jgi:hypothetical protein
MDTILASIAAELTSCRVSLVKHFGNFVEVADQNGCRYVADLTASGAFVTGSVRQTW